MRNDILSDTVCKFCDSKKLNRIGYKEIAKQTIYFIYCEDCKQTFELIASEDACEKT